MDWLPGPPDNGIIRMRDASLVEGHEVEHPFPRMYFPVLCETAPMRPGTDAGYGDGTELEGVLPMIAARASAGASRGVVHSHTQREEDEG